MRRKDREITDKAEIEAILQQATVCRIGLADGNQPYVVPVSFGYEDGNVYIHSAPEGKKLEILAENPRCCVEVDSCEKIIRSNKPCTWGMRYRSVIGSGTAAVLTDPEEKCHGLNCIVQHYGGGKFDFSEKELESVTVIRITFESVTAKKHD
jgi:uncharacterized protein